MKRFFFISLAVTIPAFAIWYNPILVANKSQTLTIQEVISDGEGGAVVMWTEEGSNTFYMQRLDFAGRILWGPNGVAVFDIPEYVEIRYPDEWYEPSIEEARKAYELAKEIKYFVLEKLEMTQTKEDER